MSVLLAIFGARCRDDGNDQAGSDATADSIATGDASDASQASSIADEPSAALDADETDAATAVGGPVDTQSPTGTGPPTDAGSPTDSSTPGATDVTAPGDASDDTQPPSSSPPPTSTVPPTSTQPIDAGTRAFCDAVVTAEMTFTRGPLVDFATADPEQIATAVDAHAATLEPMLGAAVATAPAGIAAQVDTVIGFVRSSLATGVDVESNPDYRAADELVDVFVADSCGYRKVAVSAVEYSFDTLPTSLPVGRTTFVFTNNGAEIHEMVVFRINDGVTETIEQLLALPEDEAFSKVEFRGATFGEQGETDIETLELAPGRYVALCFVPIGTTDVAAIEGDSAEPPAPPHFTAGMQASSSSTEAASHPHVIVVAMAKTKVVHACNECGAPHPKWAGQCSVCGAWNTLVEEIAAPSDTATAGTPFPSPPPVQIGDIDTQVGRPQPTGIGELDRVLGGGIVPGSVTLLGGEPGIGKSTLLLQLLAWWPASTLYVSAEESAQQVRLRAERLGAVRPDLWLVAATAMPDIVAAIDQVRPALVVVDSIQAVADPVLGSAPGSVMQVRVCAHRLVVEAKRRGIPVVLVGHVTKEGGLAGPRVLEHVVDTVLAFEGDRHHALRLLRATKHRFGPTDELGLFEMASGGLVGVPDPSMLFLADRRTGVPGSAIAPTIEGKRPMVIEVQALTAAAPYDATVRRTSQGIDGGRLALLLAVLQQRARQPVANTDVYVSTVGGVRLVEPGLDLAVCLAIVSALTGRPLPADLAVFGEVGLGGELRQVGHTRRRLSEAARLGFARAIIPGNSPNGVEGIRMVRVSTLSEALAAAGLVGEDARPAVGGGRAQ